VNRRRGKGLRAQLNARLAAQGILHEQSGTILGLLPTHRWPSSDAAHETSVRARVVEALHHGATDDAHVAALVSLLHALKATPKVVDATVLGKKSELNANAKRIAQGNGASDAVREAIDEMLAAVIAATSSSAVIAGGA
jgi:hypothetical protein